MNLGCNHCGATVCPELGEKRKCLTHARYDANDLGCVKTPKTEQRLEWFFSSRAKLNSLTNIRAPECDLAERSFYRLRAPERFYTAKTRNRHGLLKILPSIRSGKNRFIS
jgi:hypothetical protein